MDDMVQVSENAIARAILLLLERKKLVVEGAGAVGLAAVLSDSGRFRGKRVVLIISGGNIEVGLKKMDTNVLLYNTKRRCHS